MRMGKADLCIKKKIICLKLDADSEEEGVVQTAGCRVPETDQSTMPTSLFRK